MHSHSLFYSPGTFQYHLMQCLNGIDMESNYKMSRRMGKPTICKGENKGADQLRSNCETDQRLCVRFTDSTIPLLSKYKISSL